MVNVIEVAEDEVTVITSVLSLTSILPDPVSPEPVRVIV